MDRNIALVTGGNSGIGYEAARALAREGWHVLMASRDREASAAAVRSIEGESGAGAASELGLDLGSLAAVRASAKEIEARDLPIRALVCNAGLQTSGPLQTSVDGFERTFAVNHLGHFLLCHLLLPTLLRNTPSRIVVVASGVHDPALRTGMPNPKIGDWQALAETGCTGPDDHNGRLTYVNSKLCNLWFAYELARRIGAAGLSTDERPVSVNAYEPGLVPGSGLARDYPAPLRWLWNRLGPGFARMATRFTPTVNPADKSGQALARVVLDPGLERASGKYFPSHARWAEAPSSEASYDGAAAAGLWEHSVRLSELSPDESPLGRT